MRPRFMNRGSTVWSDTSSVRSDCFNEAPIHESGKCSIARVDLSTRRRFNEAPIHESGKFRSSSVSHGVYAWLQ